MPLIYGFHRLADVANTRVNEALVPRISVALDESMANYNQTIDTMAALFVKRTTDYKVKYKTPTVGRLQPLDENGRARPRKQQAEYEVGLPLKAAGDAWGANYKTLIKMTVEQVSDAVDQMQRDDDQWMIDQILAALLNAASWTYEDNDYGTLTVQPIANGDATVYLPSGGTVPATANHLLAQAAVIADATNPFSAIRAKLRGFSANAGQIIAFVAPGQRDAVEGLADFRERADPNVTPAPSAEVLTNTPDVALPANAEFFGYVRGVYVAEWSSLPDGYGVAITTQGERPVAMREEPEAELQGFNFVATRNDYPFEESQFRREAGFGAWNRLGAVAFRTGNGTYATPTGLDPAQLP